MKTKTLFVTTFILAFLSFGVLAGSSDLDEAMKYTEATMSAMDRKSIVQHTTAAITHAIAAKDDKQHKVDTNRVDEGLRSLDEALKAGNKGEIQAAQESARKAFEYFKLAPQ